MPKQFFNLQTDYIPAGCQLDWFNKEGKETLDYHQITSSHFFKMGEIRNSLQWKDLVGLPTILKNEQFHAMMENNENLSFRRECNYYKPVENGDADIYGGHIDYQFEERDLEGICRVRVYFYKFKPHVTNEDMTSKYEIVFRYGFFIENNTLDMASHAYLITQKFQTMVTEQLPYESFKQNELCKTDLYGYQKSNVMRLLELHRNGITVDFSEIFMIEFPDGSRFELNEPIKHYDSLVRNDVKIFGGIVMDEPGLGKTLQFISYLLEVLTNDKNLSAVVLVPNEAILQHWTDEFKKHVSIPLHNLKITMATFQKVATMNLNCDIIIIDELHEFFKNDFRKVFEDKILGSKIKYRWGLSGTPFVGDSSMCNIMEFLLGQKIENERVGNAPSLQDEFIKVFMRNTKESTENQYNWKKVQIHDILLEFDEAQQTMYDTEAKLLRGQDFLRRLTCQMELMLNLEVTQQISPKELKQIASDAYRDLYQQKVAEAGKILGELQQLKSGPEQYDASPNFAMHVRRMEDECNEKLKEAERYKNAYDYYVAKINQITNIVDASGNQIDTDEQCAICIGVHTAPISYFKKCGHYFCKSCVDAMLDMDRTKSVACPLCRRQCENSDIYIVDNKSDINMSAKCIEMVKLVTESDDRFIVFTQFPEMITNLSIILQRNKIPAITLEKYNAGSAEQAKVLILSSTQNAAGLELIEFNKMIIFEPFEKSAYTNQIQKQLIGRIARHGQTKEIDVYRFIMKGTIEEDIYAGKQ